MPIIILSNLNAPADVAAAIQNEVHQYLVKTDWKIDDVLKKIKEELQ
jgi:DNA-binding NarL/FixJ family response regulator